MTRRILITGGAGGIGSNTVAYLLDKRDDLEIHVADKDEEALDKIKEDVEKHNIDLNNYEEVNRLAENLNIDILVNCAGVQMQASVEDMEIEKFEQHIQNNYLAAINTTKAFLPQLKNQKESKIINISSIAGRTGFPFLSGYCASKYALEGFTDTLRKELLKDPVQVVLVEPGRVKTGFNEEGVQNMEDYLDHTRWKEEYQQKLNQDSFGGIKPEKAGKKLGEIILKRKNRPRHTINRETTLIKILKTILPTKLYDRVVYKIM